MSADSSCVEGHVVAHHADDGGGVVVERREHRLVAIGPRRREILQRHACRSRWSADWPDRACTARHPRGRSRRATRDRRAASGLGGVPVRRSYMRFACSRGPAMACDSERQRARKQRSRLRMRGARCAIRESEFVSMLMAIVHSHERLGGGANYTHASRAFLNVSTPVRRRTTTRSCSIAGAAYASRRELRAAITARVCATALPLCTESKLATGVQRKPRRESVCRDALGRMSNTSSANVDLLESRR